LDGFIFGRFHFWTVSFLGGRYKEKKLNRWILEKWEDIGHKEYPVYRPTIRVNNNTPLTVNEIEKKNLKSQIKKRTQFTTF